MCRIKKRIFCSSKKRACNRLAIVCHLKYDFLMIHNISFQKLKFLCFYSNAVDEMLMQARNGIERIFFITQPFYIFIATVRFVKLESEGRKSAWKLKWLMFYVWIDIFIDVARKTQQLSVICTYCKLLSMCHNSMLEVAREIFMLEC